MARHCLSFQKVADGGAIPDPFPPDLQWPFGRLSSLSHDEVRCSAYEIFSTACRSTSARGCFAVAGENHEGGQGTKMMADAKNMVVTSRLKRPLGLRARKTRSMVGAQPMTSAKIMRRQMGVSEQTDSHVSKILVPDLSAPRCPRRWNHLCFPWSFFNASRPSSLLT